MKKILHISHTDIRSDSRILKEMNSILNGYKDCRLLGIGIQYAENQHRTNLDDNLDIYSIDLKSRKWRFLPTVIRHFISLLELLLKMPFLIIKVRPDVIHCHDIMVLPIGVFCNLFTGSKLIYDAHELESEDGTHRFPKVIFFWEKILWKFIDALITVSPSIDSWYQKHIGAKESIVVMNTPILDRNNDISNDYLRNKFDIPASSKIFIYIGGFFPGRNIPLLLNVFLDEGIGSHAVFLGYGDLDVEIELASKKCNNIHVHKAVSHEQVVPIAKSADFGLCIIERYSLSDYYCLPNKLFEYAFSGLPVLASNFPDISKLVAEHDIGVCVEPDKDSIIESIHELEKSNMSFAMKNLQAISWSAEEIKLVNLYKKIMGIN